MSTPILATKLHIPAPRPKAVVRPHLIARLNEGLHRKLSLISAPAGFGKTTLISEWATACERPTAWLSLDEGDNELARFLTYLVATIQTIVPTIGAGVARTLKSPQPPSTESLLAALLNELSTIPGNVLLVLDDYHLLTTSAIDHALAFLLEHLPPQIHIVIATREDPALPLARLRARDQLTELRAADVRFTRAETAEFLNQVMGLNLLTADIAALETRTEGWVAGLQLAALSMQGQQNTAGFIKSFTGSHHFVLDYLVAEVLHQQPENIQQFLLYTSILDRLSGPLCDAVLLASAGQATLEHLDHANLFLVPLDDERRWYRYHHLFADLLRQRLQQPTASSTVHARWDVAELHSRASQWYEHNGFSADAIRHAFAAEDFERAANLVEHEWPAIHRSSFRSAASLGWMQALPDTLMRARPVLSVGYAWELLNIGELEAAETRLCDAERWLETTATTPARPKTPNAEMVVVDQAEFRSLPSSIATARAYHALALDDVPGTVMYARRALELFPKADHIGRGPAAALLGLAYWASGDLAAAHRTLAESMASFLLAGNIIFAISGTYGLADIKIAQGCLHEAISTYQHALQLATVQGEPVLQGTADIHLGLSALYHEQGNQALARKHLLRSEELGEQAALPDWPYRLCLVQARMKQASGDLSGTLDLLNAAERLYIRGPVPDPHPVAARKTRVWIEQGRLAEALAWAHERGVTVDDDLRYLREFEHITLARLLIAQYKSGHVHHALHEAIRLLARLQQAAEAGGRLGSVIEIGVLQALAYQAQGKLAPARAALERALKRAEPECYVRIFVDEGLAIAGLLRDAAKHTTALNYIHQLQAAFGEPVARTPVTQHATAQQVLSIEPLSEREREVLRLLRSQLSGPEIARELMVSLNTLRTHTKNIYSKLGVNNRRVAVDRAEELGLT